MASARIVVFGDTHLGFDMPVRARVERRRRGNDFAANFERVLEYTIESRADVLVHCGDLFHRSRVHPSVVNRAFGGFARVAELGIPVVVVRGNHDRSKLPPSLWLGHRNIHVFDHPRTVQLQARGLGLAFGGFPFAWGDLSSSFPELLKQTGFGSVHADAAFLCMHHTVAGATVGPDGFTFRRGKDVLPRHLLPGAAAVLSGHIHRHQVLEGSHPPVFYPGSTERTSFAERDEPKGFIDLTVGGAGGAITGWRFVPLPARAMVDIDVPRSVPAARLAGFLAQQAATLPRDAVVRIKRHATAEWPACLTAECVRSLFPPTMNVHMSWEFVRERR